MRTLRSHKQRALLYYAQDGRCAMCGSELPDDWHADHIVPYSVSGRTNVHEMQALCPVCNLKKGDKMYQTTIELHQPEDLLEFSQFRPGQADGFLATGRCLAEGQECISLVLPTRYGKSDLMRALAYAFNKTGQVATSIVLSPNAFLRDQIVNTDKLGEFQRRYGIRDRIVVRTLKRFKATKNPQERGEILFSSTVQLALSQKEIVKAWIESLKYRTGKPTLIFIDESHTTSEKNKWGGIIREFVDAGAVAVLLTATPYRTDGEIIPGFDVEEVSREDVTIYTTGKGSKPEKVKVDVWAGEKRLYRLKADHETTFAQAWAEQVLCKISRLPFDVDLDHIKDDKIEEGRLLSELGPSAAKKTLGRIVRHQFVIREGVRRLVNQLRIMQKSASSVQALVFCGSDMETDKEANKHANAIRGEIEAIAHDLVVTIATSADENAVDKIKSFANGVGDVMIVKQMAGAGMDAPHCKIELDLSPVRTVASYAQRLMRIATITPTLRHAVYIAPDDCVGRALFDFLVVDNDGEAREPDDVFLGNATDLELVESFEKDREPSATDLYMVSALAGADFEDNLKNFGRAELLEGVNRLFQAVPGLAQISTHAEVATGLESMGVHLVTENGGPVDVADTGAEDQAARDDLSREALKYFKLLWAQSGMDYGVYGQTIAQFWRDVYAGAGLEGKKGTLETLEKDECVRCLLEIGRMKKQNYIL